MMLNVEEFHPLVICVLWPRRYLFIYFSPVKIPVWRLHNQHTIYLASKPDWERKFKKSRKQFNFSFIHYLHILHIFGWRFRQLRSVKCWNVPILDFRIIASQFCDSFAVGRKWFESVSTLTPITQISPRIIY